MKAGIGDMLIEGVKGELYGCRADIFAATYEPVETTLATPSFPAQPAAELRRLHAQSAQDEALLRQALEALEQIARDLPWELTGLQADTITALRERLQREAAKESKR
jgi:hypothetical protein